MKIDLIFNFLFLTLKKKIKKKNTMKKVIIIGSGVSGLAASNLLKNKGIDIQILEARHIHGGRISHNTTFADFAIETGAEEIHIKESKYYEMA